MLAINHSIHWEEQKLPLTEFVERYNQLFQEAINLFAEFNPCEIHDSSCIRGRMINDRTGKHEDNFCCEGCEYLTDQGCITNSMWCKLWSCLGIRENKGFRVRQSELRRRADDLCTGRGGRYGLDIYIKRFYSEEEYGVWKTTEVLSQGNSLLFEV